MTVTSNVSLNAKPGIAPSRRDALKALLAFSAVGVAGCVGGRDDKTGAKAKPTTAPKALSAANMVLLTAIVDTIIPTTDTPGAVDAGVPQTLSELVSDWGDDNFRRFWVGGLNDLDKTFTAANGQAFAKMSPKQREAALDKYDADVFAGKVENEFYKSLKSTAATAYYMSEPGATEELIYEAVPGEWKGCIPFSDVGRTWAT